MMSESAIHDAGAGLTLKIVSQLENCVRPEELRELYDVVLTLAKEAFKEYEIRADRMHRRVRLSSN